MAKRQRVLDRFQVCDDAEVRSRVAKILVQALSRSRPSLTHMRPGTSTSTVRKRSALAIRLHGRSSPG